MSSSKVMADRMMLDIKALMLSLEYVIRALQDGERDIRNQGEQVLEAVRSDIESVKEDHIMADSLSTYYDYAISEQYDKFNHVINKIENGFFKDALAILDDLNKKVEEKLSEHLRERVT